MWYLYIFRAVLAFSPVQVTGHLVLLALIVLLTFDLEVRF
jgi:hypothetical protein